MTTTTDAPARLSPGWWALQLDVSESSVRRWIRDGHLRATRYGRLVRISEADMAAFGRRQGGTVTSLPAAALERARESARSAPTPTAATVDAVVRIMTNVQAAAS